MDRTQLATAALLLGRATLKILPAAQPIQPYVTDDVFGYDFIYKGAFHNDLIPEIERFMQRIKNEKEPLVQRTMMRENAVVFLQHHEKLIQAEIAEASRDNMVQLVDFDLVQGELLESFSELSEYRLFDVIQKTIDYPPLGEISWLRITGKVFPDKQAMKSYTKLDAAVKKIDPVTVCRKLDLIDLKDRPFWLPAGMRFRDGFIKIWQQELEKCGIVQVLAPFKEETKRGLKCSQERDIEYFNASFMPRHQECAEYAKVAQWVEKESDISEASLDGLFRTLSSTGDLFRIVVDEWKLEETLTCLLQFIQNIATLLSFEPYYTLLKPSSPFVKVLSSREFVEKRTLEGLSGTRLEVHFRDLKGHEWLTSVIQVEEKKGATVVLRGSFVFSLERILALVVQKNAGLPQWAEQIAKLK